MIDFTKGIFQSGEFLKVFLSGNWCNINEAEYPDAWKQVQDWLAENPEYVIVDDAPPAPTPEQLNEREIAEKLAYLASTDWYVVRYAETGVAIPAEVSAARAAARTRIDELRA